MEVVACGLHLAPRVTSLPTLFISHVRPSCKSSLFRLSHPSHDHVSFIKEIAAIQPPENLNNLLKMLQIRGDTIISPASREGLIPLVIPLSKNKSGTITALLRWPTAPPGMQMPVVEVHKHGIWLLAKKVDEYIHRMLVEEDAKSLNELFNALGDAGKKLYIKGDFAESEKSNLDVYLLKKVGLFPDIIERKAMQYFDKGDEVSAMVTAEFYTRNEHFPGFGRPFLYLAKILSKVGRDLAAKDSARVALKSPWWTLGCKYQEAASLAQWEDVQIEYMNEKVTKEGREEDLKKGKDPTQIALDEAAFLLDLASVEGRWDDFVERIAECYEAGGLHDVANFVLHRD